MAAHLDLFHLRRHAMPAPFIALTDHLAEAPALSGHGTMAAHARLLATWQLDASGRPVCHWSVDADNP